MINNFECFSSHLNLCTFLVPGKTVYPDQFCIMKHNLYARVPTLPRDLTKIKLLSINIHRKNEPTCNTVTVAHIYALLDGVKIKRYG